MQKVPLKDLLALPLMNGIFKTKDYYGEGVPLINVYDLYQDTEIDIGTLERIIVDDNELSKYRVDKGDLFFVRSSLKWEGVAWVSIINSLNEPSVFECHLIRVRPNPASVLPEYLSYYCRTLMARDYLMARASVTTMATIEQTAIEQMPILLPPLPVQRELVAGMQAARERRVQRLRDADAALAGMDAFLLDALGLTPPPADDRTVYAVRLKQLLSDEHLDADYYNPERILAIRVAQEHASKGLYSSRLQDIVYFMRDQVPADSNPNYLGLASVQSHTGELVPVEEEVTGNCFAFVAGDVLFARLRPYLNKVHCAEQGGICSPEFHVMRARSVAETGIEVVPDYLATVLRSSLVLAQTRHMMTGNTHPRLANEDVANLIVPIPKDTGIQQTITEEVQSRRERARALREEAAREWGAAKAAFERRLLGDDV